MAARSTVKATWLAAVAAMLVVTGACAGDEPSTVAAGSGAENTAENGTDGAAAAGGAPRVSTLAPTCASLEPEPVVEGPLSDDPEIADAQEWRAGMGLRTDEAWVAAVPTMPTTRPEADTFQYPLTDDEVTAVLARGNDDALFAATLAYAERHPATYGGRWLDNAAGGVLTLAFTAEVNLRQAELDAELGSGAVRVLEVERTEAELLALQSEIQAFLAAEGIAASGLGTDVVANVVAVGLAVLDDASVGPLVERFGTEGFCVDGADPAEVIPEGPQPDSGDGWRLLADAPGLGAPYRTGVAADAAAYDALWAEIGLSGEPPPVDHAIELVVWFGPAVSGSCNAIRLDDVVVDAESALVYPTIVLPGGNQVCSSDANAHAYVVALERATLPAEFTVQLGPEVVCAGCTEAGEPESTPVTLEP